MGPKRYRVRSRDVETGSSAPLLRFVARNARRSEERKIRFGERTNVTAAQCGSFIGLQLGFRHLVLFAWSRSGTSALCRDVDVTFVGLDLGTVMSGGSMDQREAEKRQARSY